MVPVVHINVMGFGRLSRRVSSIAIVNKEVKECLILIAMLILPNTKQEVHLAGTGV